MDDISGFDITIDDVECFSALKHKTVLITGGTGLICSWLVRYLMFLNDRYSFDIDIFLLVRSLNKAESMFGIDSHIHYYKQDITEPINYCFDNIDYWVLGACNAYPGAFKEMPVDILDQNYLGVHNACSYIIEKGICPQKIIYISSSEVYGEYDFVDGVTEDFLGNVNQASLRACYSEGKRATETLCFAYSYQYGINISIARPGYIFGFIPYTKSNRADIEFFTNANNHEPIILTSLGSQIRSYCYVEDTVRALLYILLYGEDKEAYNIALDAKESITIAQFAEKIANKAGVNVIRHYSSPDIGWSPYSKAILNNKKIKGLGWLPKFSVDEGILKTLILYDKLKLRSC